MVARKGYKLTEVGEIPDDWEVKPLGQFLSIGHGKSQKQVEDIHGEYPILASGGKIGTANAFLYDKPSVLIGRKGTIDAPQYMDTPFWCVDTLFYTKVKIRNIPKYLYYKFCLIPWREYNEASGVPSLNAKTIESIFIATPPLDAHNEPAEQTAIVTALSDADALIEALEQSITKKRYIKQGAMQELLTGKKRLPGFEGEWEEKELSALCSMKSGSTITESKISTIHAYPCIGGNGLRGYTFTFTHDGHYVLIGRQGALCGNIVEIEGKFFASEHALVVTVKPHVAPSYLAHAFKHRNLNQYSESSAQPGLSAQKLLTLTFLWPPTLEEQTTIAAVLTDMDDDISALEAKLTKARQIKAGMMQELLTGRIRLI